MKFNTGKNDWSDPAAWIVVVGGVLLCIGWFMLWL
ncbi:hypothetical protein J2736_006680 [Paenibacillus qinlingensis]|uniref:Uncharacterized protein n=1 Tax=Paenibacillus qinlingensis TaxID=1837343 RepID=A0ABU1P6M2_9BACL|nr:hypothetical protein [Paenibacillus qinlingensis]